MKICHISFDLKFELNQHISSVHDGCITMVNNETLNHEKTLITDNDLSHHNDGMIMCHGCEIPATHFCKSCNQNLCKFCIINHYKNIHLRFYIPSSKTKILFWWLHTFMQENFKALNLAFWSRKFGSRPFKWKFRS